MFTIEDLTAPVWGDTESGSKFLVDALSRWEEALSLYSGKSEKSSAKVSKVIETIKETDEDAVAIVDEVMNQVRSLVIDAVNANVNTTYLLFSELEDVKKAVGSWRSDANVTVEQSDDDSDDERDLIAEYEALNKGRTMIEGTFNAFGLNVMDLPEKYRAQKSERVNGKNVKTGDWYLKFPGKLTSPLNESETNGGGRTATSMQYLWEVTDGLGTLAIGKASFPYLARVCSTSEVIMSTDDLLTSIKAKHGDSFTGNDTLSVRTPRGQLVGIKVKK